MSCGSRARSCSSWTRAGRRCRGPQWGFPRDSLFFSFHLAGISQIFYFCEQGILFLDCKDCLGVAGEDGDRFVPGGAHVEELFWGGSRSSRPAKTS